MLTIRSSMSILLFCVLGAVLLPSSGPGSSAANRSADPHSSFRQSSQCGKCHRYEGQKLVPGRFDPASVDLCLECHLIEARGPVHPFRVHPGIKFRDMRVPPEYPLDEKGTIMCLTCHNAHGAAVSTARAYKDQAPVNSGRQPGEAPYYKTYYLRRTNPSGEGFDALCSGCHKAL